MPCYFTIKALADLHILRVLCIGAPLLTVVKAWGKSNTAIITVRVFKGDISSITLIMGLIYLLHPSFTSLTGNAETKLHKCYWTGFPGRLLLILMTSCKPNLAGIADDWNFTKKKTYEHLFRLIVKNSPDRKTGFRLNVSRLHHSPILVCKCRFIVRRLSKDPLLCKLAAFFALHFNLNSGHVLQSGITRESLKVSPMLDRTAAEAAMTLFWSHDCSQPIGNEQRSGNISAV